MMKRFQLLSVVLLCCFVEIACSQSQTVFVASTPCNAVSPPLPGMQADTACELIKWKLTLYEDSFTLEARYGLPKAGTTGFVGGGKAIELQGKWLKAKGMASNPQATIYQLKDTKTQKTISFCKLNDNVLHLLDDEGNLMIGSAAWSYTLNRLK